MRSSGNLDYDQDDVYGAVIVAKPTFRPSQLTWAVSPLVKAATEHIHCCHLLSLCLKADNDFTIPWMMEGTVNLGTAVKV